LYPVSLGDELHLAGGQVIDGAHHFDRALLDARADDRVEPLERRDAAADIGFDYAVDFAPFAIAGFTHRRDDDVNQFANRARRWIAPFRVLNRRFDRAAVAMAEHDDQGRL